MGTNFFDIFLIFIIGAIEFYIFSSLVVDDFQFVEYQQRLFVILIVAVFGHARAFVGIKEENFDTYEEYKKETRLQMSNILSMLSILALSIISMTGNITFSSNGESIIALIQSAILSYSIYYSLISTFKFTTYTKELNLKEDVDSDKVKVDLEVVIKQAAREDVNSILDLMLRNFYYVYGSLLGTNLQLTKRILKKIITSNRGRHNLGYKVFNVALEKELGAIVGLIMASKNPYSSKYYSLVTFLYSFFYILINLGLIGVARTL